jgi:alpha-L-fucosidase
MQQRLRDIGSWLRINGEAIYSTRPWPAAREQRDETSDTLAVRYTRKGSDLFVILPEWPDGEVVVSGLDNTNAVSVRLLGYDGPIDWQVHGDNVVIDTPRMSPADVPSPYAYVFKITGALR